MKVLVATDFHGKKKSTEYLENFLKRDYDLLLVLGDITQFGPPSQADEIIDLIKEYDTPVFALPGNCDPREIVSKLEESGISLHSRIKDFQNISFVGLGGSNKTPFDTPFELSETEIHEKLKENIKKAKDRWVLVTHAPPYNTSVDQTSSGDHAGSESIRKIIEKNKPVLNVCGHIHEARAVDGIGSTKVVNPGPISEGYAAEVLISREQVGVELL